MTLEMGVRVSRIGCACVWESSVTLETGVRGCACLSTTDLRLYLFRCSPMNESDDSVDSIDDGRRQEAKIHADRRGLMRYRT